MHLMGRFWEAAKDGCFFFLWDKRERNLTNLGSSEFFQKRGDGMFFSAFLWAEPSEWTNLWARL